MILRFYTTRTAQAAAAFAQASAAALQASVRAGFTAVPAPRAGLDKGLLWDVSACVV